MRHWPWSLMLSLALTGAATAADPGLQRKAELRKEGIDKPIFAGGVVPPWAIRRLHALNVVVHPPGSQLPDIVASAEHLTGRGSAPSS